MAQANHVLEYKCPCCNAGLSFSGASQQLTCEYCGNTFDPDTIRAWGESQTQPQTEEVHWEAPSQSQWAQEEQEALNAFQCPSCGGEILCENTTAASFCPYCGNPTILPSRLDGLEKPDAVLPFQKTREDAKAAFLSLCRKKKLLPKEFLQEQQVEKITGLYVPFWLYDCQGSFSGSYKATRIHSWSDRNFIYTKTDHFLLTRGARANFQGIPMDGSSKMDDTFMESIEPFDYSKMIPFDMAYLSGYLADKYDVPSQSGEGRIKERVDAAITAELQPSLLGYHSVVPTSRQLQVAHSKARYVLLPVWILTTRYKDQPYTFAMNGQSGKMTGAFPICPKKSAAWFAGVTAAVTAITYALQWLVLM